MPTQAGIQQQLVSREQLLETGSDVSQYMVQIITIISTWKIFSDDEECSCRTQYTDLSKDSTAAVLGA